MRRHVRSLTSFYWRVTSVILVSLLVLLEDSSGLTVGDKNKYPVEAIPDSLLTDANIVVRLDEFKFRVEDINKATAKVKKVVTILEPAGREYGNQNIYYDKFRKISNIKGMIRDSHGKKIRGLKKDEIKDYSASSSLYDDHRIKVCEIYYDIYPYTVEFEYELKFNGLINWPAWYPQKYEEPVEKSIYELSVPQGITFRFKTQGLNLKPTVSSENANKKFRWEIHNLPKYEREPYGPQWSEQLPSLIVAPDRFEIEGYEGNMSSWKNFGAWYYELAKNRNNIADKVKAEVAKLTSGAINEKEKVKRLYNYLQDKTRYVSIQLGIGGWQPFDAIYVAQKGYGDCKALTNYMKALLEAANIPAYPALVRNGTRERAVPVDFPNNQFNHVILSVPSIDDTVWLECTSQSMPFNHIGSSNEDRNVLLITPEGGKLVRTPISKYSQNQQVRYATVNISKNGNAVAEIKTTYSGNQQDRIRRALAQSSHRDREIWLRNSIDIPRFKLVSADFSEINQKNISVSIPCKLQLAKYASMAGSRLLFRPNLMEQWKNVPDKVEERTQPVKLAYTYLDIDSINYQIPTGYKIEAMPEDIHVEKDFGLYSASFSANGNNMLIYKRRLEFRKKFLPPGLYDEYRNFIKAIVKSDRSQVVLVK